MEQVSHDFTHNPSQGRTLLTTRTALGCGDGVKRFNTIDCKEKKAGTLDGKVVRQQMTYKWLTRLARSWRLSQRSLDALKVA